MVEPEERFSPHEWVVQPDRYRLLTPAHKLLVTLLSNAWKEVHRIGIGADHPAVSRDAIQWFHSCDHEWPWSFPSICDELQLSRSKAQHFFLTTSPRGTQVRAAERNKQLKVNGRPFTRTIRGL